MSTCLRTARNRDRPRGKNGAGQCRKGKMLVTWLDPLHALDSKRKWSSLHKRSTPGRQSSKPTNEQMNK
eukprot:scaffold1228_cov246-Pinguiococcus_pyrenoidosus.AAC.3